MRAFVTLICAGFLLTGAYGKQPAGDGFSSTQQQPNESQLIEHGRYTNKSGQSVHSPAHTKDGKAPQGATAKCQDGSYSFSQHHRGTCSGHRGVTVWLRPQE